MSRLKITVFRLKRCEEIWPKRTLHMKQLLIFNLMNMNMKYNLSLGSGSLHFIFPISKCLQIKMSLGNYLSYTHIFCPCSFFI